MHCEWVERHLSAYHDGALDKHTANQMSAHLATCPHCSAILDEYDRFDVTLKRLPRVSPSPALRDRIFTAPEFRELVQPRKSDAVPTPITPMPAAQKAGHVARLVTQIAAVLVIVSGAGLLINNILAHQRSGPLYASCPHALSSGERLVYRVGNALYSNTDKLVCDTQARVGVGWQVSPDGRWVAYVNTTRGELRLVRANSTGDHAIDSGDGTVVQLAWAPDSQRLFIVKQVGTQQYTLASVDPNQVTAQILAHFAVGTVLPHLAISPDGRYLAIQVSHGTPNGAASVILYDAANPSALAHIDLAAPATDFGWIAGSPAQFTWAEPAASGATMIGVANADGAGAQTASLHGVTAAGVNSQGVWALAGTDGSLRSYDAVLQRQTTLAHIANVAQVVWSPDTTHLAVVSNGALWLVSPTGALQIAANAGAFTPTWSADSSTLSFGGPAAIQVFNVASNTLQATSLAGEPAEMPEWSQAQ